MTQKNLYQFVDELEREGLLVSTSIDESNKNVKINKISYNSMDVELGTLFVCKGETFKESYLQSAIDKGANCFIYGDDFTPKADYLVPYIRVNNTRKALAVIANSFYDKCWQNLSMIGITGTKGKTTVAYYTRYILEGYLQSLEDEESKIAFLSSIKTYDGVGGEEEASLTTPETFELYEHFNNAVNSGLKYLIMEASSQALKYHRTYGIKYNIGCFTNVSKDHISDSEHPDFEDYFKSKLIIFGQVKTAIINSDIEETNLSRIYKAAEQCEKVVTYGLSPDADVRAINIVETMSGLSFDMNLHGEILKVEIPVIGRFNVVNALAAAAIAYELSVPTQWIVKGLSNGYVPGRMNVFHNVERNVTGIVDFAHNTISYEAMFGTIRNLRPDAPLTIIFGGSEGKGINRRKDCADVANKYVNRIVLTEEDPGEEDVMSICQEIQGYITNPNIDVHIILSRGEAIKYALDNCPENGIVIVAGKGTDTTIKRKGGYEVTPTDVDFVKMYLEI